MTWKLLFHRFAKSRSRVNLYEWITEAVADWPMLAGAKLLTIGAGGEIGEHLATLGLSTCSVDIDPSRQPDIVASIEDLSPIADSSVDGIFCLEVLEHVANPQAAVDSVMRVLKPGGKIIGSTPFLLGIHDAPHDYYRFTEHGLRYLFSEFEVLRLKPRNGYMEGVAVLLYRRFVTGTPNQRRRSVLLGPIIVLFGLILELLGRLLPAEDGTTGYFFVIRKSLS
ncbi:MAG: methyltransferase domain-containing protein [Propionivibrio sp.]|nr:methyltransferase domain-containing protein [Propionivibrio sp.]